MSDGSDKHITWAKAALADFEYFCKYCVKIRDKQGLVKPFIWNSSQRRLYYSTIKPFEDLKLPIRVIILKARQMGFSTFIEIYILWRLLRKGNISALEMAHEKQESAPHIFDISRFAIKNLPQWFRYGYAAVFGSVLEEDYFTKTDVTFNTGSSLSVTSADSREPGRSLTIQLLHLCMHKDSRVVLADGSSKAIKDVQIGDKVITSTGATATVSGKYYSGVKATIKVKTWLSNEFIAITREHKVLTDSGWKCCGELTKDDYIQLPQIKLLTGKIKFFEFSLPNKSTTHGSKHLEYAKIPLDFDFGYLLGYYLAEGSIKRQYRYNDRYCYVSFASHKEENYVDRVIQYAQENKLITSYHKKIIGNRKVVILYGTFFAHLIDNICGRKECKHVPQWFFKTNAKFIDGVLAGYLSGDGSKKLSLANGKYPVYSVAATSICERISRQIKRLILARGYGVPSLYYTPVRYRYGVQTKPVYTLMAFGKVGQSLQRLMGMSNDCGLQEHSCKYKRVGKKWFVKVKCVEEYEEADVYDITVDHPAHDFETPVGIVSNSEVGFYEEAEKVLAPLFAAMPKTNDTAVFMESTGNGPAGLFFNTFQRAKKGRNSYKALFFPWYEHEEYRMDVPEGIKPYCPPELEKLYQEGRITDEQLYWRQWVIENDFDGDETLFCVEYPSTEEQAWMSNSANWFDTGAIHQRLKEVDSVPYDEGFLYNDDGVVKFHASPDEKLHVFKYPEPGRVYVIGADAGSGVVVNREGDPSCADVLDVLTGEQVAHLHMTAKPTTFAFELKLLATWYNNAMIAPEVTGGHGLSAALWLIDNGYYNIFQKRVYDKTTQMFTNKIGWDTSRSNKIVVVNLLRAAFLNGEVIINEKGTLREMLTFIKPINKKTGTVRHDKAEAMAGAKDDRVISMCIANAVRKDMFSAQVPQLKAKEKEENREEESPPPPGFIRVNLRRPEVKQTSLNQVGF